MIPASTMLTFKAVWPSGARDTHELPTATARANAARRRLPKVFIGTPCYGGVAKALVLDGLWAVVASLLPQEMGCGC